MTRAAGTSSAAKRRQADVRRPPSWWDLHPTLHLTLYPVQDHLRLTLVYKTQPKGAQVVPRVLLQADWAPSEVTEQRAVEWAQRALQAYLTERLEAGLPPVPED